LLQFFQRPSGVADDLLIDEFQFASRGQHRNQARNAVDDVLRIALTVRTAPRRLSQVRACVVQTFPD